MRPGVPSGEHPCPNLDIRESTVPARKDRVERKASLGVVPRCRYASPIGTIMGGLISPPELRPFPFCPRRPSLLSDLLLKTYFSRRGTQRIVPSSRPRR